MDEVLEPEGKKFKCSLLEFDSMSKMNVFDTMTSDECIIKVIPSPSGLYEINTFN